MRLSLLSFILKLKTYFISRIYGLSDNSSCIVLT